MATTESKIEDFAEDLGKMLGQARNKAEGWLGQRQTIVKNLTELRDEATKLLQQLGHDIAAEVPSPRGPRGRLVGSKNVVRRGPGRPVGSKNLSVVNKLRGVEPRRRTMSAKARKAISDAQKKR